MLFWNGGAFIEKNEKADQYSGLVLAMTVSLLAGCSGGGSGNGEMLPHQAEKAAMWKKIGEIHWNLRMITVTVIFRR